MGKINQNKILGIVFLIIMFVTAVVSGYRLMKYYVYDLTVNEESADSEHPLENDYIANICGKENYVELNGLMHSLLGQKEMNGVVKLNNGYLTKLFDKVDETVLADEAGKVSEFSKYLEARGTRFLYVSTPYTVSKYDPQLPAGEQDYTNENIDIFLEELSKQNVEYLDLRESFYHDGLDQYDYFFKTDHHWTSEGGFYAYTKINTCIENALGVTAEKTVTDINSYSVTVYKHKFLGSNGQRVGSLYAGTDDFDLLLPDFDTDLQRMEDGEKGSFKDILINTGPLDNTEDALGYVYDDVFWHTLSDWKNNDAGCPDKILIICDSMGRAVKPYLILSYAEVRTLDAYSVSDELSGQYIENYDPDMVILMQYPSLLGHDYIFDFGI